MNVLMVTPFAPYRDGIATYAVQELRRLRQEAAETGDTIDVLSPAPSAARWHLNLGTPSALMKLVKMAAGYDRVIVQFSPEMLFGGCRSAAQRAGVWAGLAALARRTSLDIRIHEVEYGPLEQNPIERRAARLALDLADRVTVHTEAERATLNDQVRLGRRIEIVDHGRDFVPAVVRTRDQARADLGLPAKQFIFVSIGFLQHHKGFDRAVDAIELLSSTRPRPDVHLHVVGSARVDHPDITGYVERLQQRCAAVANATLHQRFVGDIEFDLWLQAADVVVVPYREIWSSGVVERARMFERQLLASDLPQLRDQVPPGTVHFADVQELAAAMGSLWSEAAANGGTARDELDYEIMEYSRSFDPAYRSDLAEMPQWQVSVENPDRLAIEAQVAARARSAELAPLSVVASHHQASAAVDGLLALGHLHRPQPTSARPGVAPIKKLIHRLVDWQVAPLASRLEDLQRATIEAVVQLEQRSARSPIELDHPGSAPASPTALSGSGSTAVPTALSGSVSGADRLEIQE